MFKCCRHNGIQPSNVFRSFVYRPVTCTFPFVQVWHLIFPFILAILFVGPICKNISDLQHICIQKSQYQYLLPETEVALATMVVLV